MALNSKLAARLTSPLALLLLATLIATGVALLAYHYLEKREDTMRAELAANNQVKTTPKVNVVVPNADVEANTVVNGARFVSRPVDDDLVYPDTLLAKDFQSVQGLRLARPVLRGRPVRMSDLQQAEVNDVSAILPHGTRAMTIDIDNLNSIAQTLQPNHRVDIFLISRAARSPDGRVQGQDDKALEQASLFMQDMVVLATGREFRDVSNPVLDPGKMAPAGGVEGATESSFDSITLLVKPREAAKLMVGQRMGTFRVVLRGRNDRDALALRPLRARDLMPAGERGRDAGIEYIVGGRNNILSRLDTLPSQARALQAAADLAGGAAVAPAAAASPAPSPAPSSAPSPAAPAGITEPIRSLRGGSF